MERPKKEWKKELGEGHYLDRRSGTGREYLPSDAGTDPGKQEAVTATSETLRICSNLKNT